MDLPVEYISYMKRLLKDDYPRYEESFRKSRFFGLRVNTSKISVDEFLNKKLFDLTPVPWTDNGFYYGEDERPSKHPYYYAGLYYIQEPSAMAPAAILPIEDGDIVLDLCAAPGGKSTELGSKLINSHASDPSGSRNIFDSRSLLVSNDISASRAKSLLKNIELFGIHNVCVMSENSTSIKELSDVMFNKILIDAPCSGEGMFRKDSKLISCWTEERPSEFAAIQRTIVTDAADMLAPGGMMIYSTCTFNKMENEDTIIFLLKERDDLELVDIPKMNGFCPGFTDTDDEKEYHLERAARLFPHSLEGEGHFVALIRKKGQRLTPSERPYLNIKNKNKISEYTFEFLSGINKDIDRDRLDLINDKVFLRPVTSFSRKNSGARNPRFLRNGLFLGEEKKNRFEPSQALAMALKSDEYHNIIDLPVSDIRVEDYLKGNTISFDTPPAEDGYVLFCVDGYPLGWGKLSGKQMKNKYLPGWRKL